MVNGDNKALFLVQADTGYYLDLNFFFNFKQVLINKVPVRKKKEREREMAPLHPSTGCSLCHTRGLRKDCSSLVMAAYQLKEARQPLLLSLQL